MEILGNVCLPFQWTLRKQCGPVEISLNKVGNSASPFGIRRLKEGKLSDASYQTALVISIIISYCKLARFI